MRHCASRWSKRVTSACGAFTMTTSSCAVRCSSIANCWTHRRRYRIGRSRLMRHSVDLLLVSVLALAAGLSAYWLEDGHIARVLLALPLLLWLPGYGLSSILFEGLGLHTAERVLMALG